MLNLSEQRIVVIGAGFLGRQVVNQLIAAGQIPKKLPFLGLKIVI
jgi:GDP-L-fucose synthase